jgi:hypothetical protein
MSLNQNDFTTPITGNVTVINNSARVILQANADFNSDIETNEFFRIKLRKGDSTGTVLAVSNTVEIKDTTNTKVFVSLVSNLPAEAMADTANVRFTLRTRNISPGDNLYYYTTGNVTSSNFVGGNTGTFNVGLIEDGTGIANIVLTAADIPANTTAVFQLNIAETPLGTPNVTSNTVTILDLNLTQLAATGGSIVTSGGFRRHTFTTSGTFLVTQTGLNPTPVSYLVVAGGGGGGGSLPATGAGGGGGAGGFRALTTTIPNATSPNTPYTITVGGGGAGGPTTVGGNGGSSSAFATTSTGGGGGGGGGGPTILGQPGGSGGGFGRRTPGQSSGGGTPGQGNPGSTYALYPGLPRWSGSGGGGGAGGPGENPPAPPIPNVLTRGHSGGPGALWPGNGGTYAGGGAGGSGDYPTPPATAPAVPGGGAAGGAQFAPGNAAPANTGGGGSGAGWAPSNTRAGGSGGSGIVVIRYPFS